MPWQRWSSRNGTERWIWIAPAESLMARCPNHGPSNRLNCYLVNKELPKMPRTMTLMLALVAALLPSLASAAAADGAVTFTRDVAPIFYKRCAECHRPTMFAPMSLITYESARPWAKSIKQKVASRQMPPWGADAAYGAFKNDPRLTQAEIDATVAGVDAGAPT